MRTAYIFGLSTVIGAFLIVTPPAYCQRAERNSLERRTKFIIYDNNNEETFVSTSKDDNLEDALAECWPTKKYALIVHGLGESCSTSWTTELRKNLITHRGGCILCMDYHNYSADYGFLLANYKPIAKILTDKLEVLRDLSFDSAEAFIFGFSYGARIVTTAGIDFGPKQIGTIHLCEQAGPGFDGRKNADPKLAAIRSQCIHTASGGFGTTERICHQDWLMGKCGESQIGQRPFPLGNHGLCPVFYNYAFTNKFAAVEKAVTCHQPAKARDAFQLPLHHVIRMGYFQNIPNSSQIEVNLYAVTTKDPPFNKCSLHLQ